MLNLSHLLVLTTIPAIAIALTASTTTSPPPSTRQRRIILDTDIFSDVDDVGALAIANIAHNCGYIDLAGVAISTTSKYGALAASAVNSYYNNGDIPIAARRPLTNDTFFDSWFFRLGEFASKLAYHYPRAISTADETPTPLALYRSLLASSSPSLAASSSSSSIILQTTTPSTSSTAKTTLVIIGFLSNLADLLRSPPDAISSLSGLNLVRSTVAEVIVMGGVYPDGGWEFNFAGAETPTDTKYVLDTLREQTGIPVTYLGSEFGSSVISGSSLRRDAPSDSPILAAYEWYVTRCNTASASYDPLTVLYAVLAQHLRDDLFAFGNDDGGHNSIAEDGTNVWVDDPAVRNQHWLKLRPDRTLDEVVEMLDALLAQNGADVRCDVFDRFHHSAGDDKLEL